MSNPQIQVVGADGLVTGLGGGTAKFQFENLVGTVQTVKATGGTLYAFYAINNQAATAAYIQVFDVAGTVTLGTTIPDLQVYAAALSVVFIPIPSQLGVNFSNAIKCASTTAVRGNTGSASGVYVYALYA